MALHLGGFAEDIDLAATLQNLAALADPQLFRSGDTLRVPALNKVFGMFGGLGSGSTQIMQLVAPSLREIGNFLVTPTNGNADADVEPDDPPVGVDLTEFPLELRRGENMTVEAQADTTAAAFTWLLLVMGDQLKPVPAGKMRTLRFTMANSLTARVWSNSDITATEELPEGEYAVIGMRAVGASVIAARLVPRGGDGWRPGCIGGDTHGYQDHPMFRYGRLGEWLRFMHDNIPSVDFLTDLGDSDVDVFLDVVKVG